MEPIFPTPEQHRQTTCVSGRVVVDCKISVRSNEDRRPVRSLGEREFGLVSATESNDALEFAHQ